MKPDPRALAARALAEVALGGTSLREALAQALPRVPQARDRAFVTALVNEGARWWLRFDVAVGWMLQRPLQRRAAPVRAALVLALVQLEIMDVAPHAAVAASVEAVRWLGFRRMAGLCNAVLRRWQRERAEFVTRLDAQPTTRHAMPAWLLKQLHADWPDYADALLAAGNAASPPVLRVNRRKQTRAELLEGFAAAGVQAEADADLADAVQLAKHVDVTGLPGFAEGAFAVQSGAAQWAVEALDVRSRQRVLDACAAPGGKAAHVLERADVELLALDNDAVRLARVRDNFARLGVSGQVLHGDAGTPDAWWDGRAFDRILLDAPCSATGVVRRHPDIKLHRRASDVAALQATQARLLRALWPTLAPGGRLVYATCSLLRAENEAVVAPFVAGRDDVQVVPWPAAVGQSAGAGRQLLPGVDGFDGMFYAILEKAGG